MVKSPVMVHEKDIWLLGQAVQHLQRQALHVGRAPGEVQDAVYGELGCVPNPIRTHTPLFLMAAAIATQGTCSIFGKGVYLWILYSF